MGGRCPCGMHPGHDAPDLQPAPALALRVCRVSSSGHHGALPPLQHAAGRTGDHQRPHQQATLLVRYTFVLQPMAKPQNS